MLPETVRNYIHAHQSEAVETLSKLIGFPSVATPQPQDGFPYGKTAADALDFMLEQLSALGMTCTNYDYHMGAADWDSTLPPHLAFSATWTWFRQFRRTGLLIRSPPKIRNAASTAEGPLTTKDRLWRSCTPPCHQSCRNSPPEKRPVPAGLQRGKRLHRSRLLSGARRHAAAGIYTGRQLSHHPSGKGHAPAAVHQTDRRPHRQLLRRHCAKRVPADASVSLSAPFCGTKEQGSQITRSGDKLAYKALQPMPPHRRAVTTPSPVC